MGNVPDTLEDRAKAHGISVKEYVALHATAEQARAFLDDCLAMAPRERPKPDKDERIIGIAARGRFDTRFFAHCFLAETFDRPTTWQYDKQWDILDNDSLPKIAQLAWRGFGKSAAMTAKMVKGICYRQLIYAIYVSKTNESATSETENVKREILGNERIRYVFGNFKGQTYNGVETQFSRTAWYVSDPSRDGEPFGFINPRGAEQQVRGTNVHLRGRKQRPNMIFCDDLEDDQLVLSEENRQSLSRWFFGSLMEIIDTAKQPASSTRRWNVKPGEFPPWRVFYADTLKHEDALIAHLVQDPSWQSVVLPQCERRLCDDGKNRYFSLVPELVTHEQVREEAANAKRQNRLDTYAREKMCKPVPPEEAQWTRDGFKYYRDEEAKLNNNPNIDRFIVVDPAKSANPKSDPSAALFCAADSKGGALYFRHLINERMEPHEFSDEVLRLSLVYNTPHLFIEHTGGSDGLKHHWKNRAAERRLPVEFYWLSAHQPTRYGDYGTGRDAVKRARAAQIIPYYKMGYVYHDESLKNSALEQQELSYPKPARWDALDCAGYVPQALEFMGRYMIPQIEDEKEDDYANPYDAFDNDSDIDRMIETGNWMML